MEDESGPKGDPAKHILGMEEEEDEDESYTDDAVWTIQEYGIDLNAGEIWLAGSEGWTIGAGIAEANEFQDPGVEFTMANKFLKGLRILSNEFEEDATLLIHMNTIGGQWEHGMAIYQAIRQCPQHTVLLNYAAARSMSSLIALAADRFIMMENTTYMVHNGQVGFDGTMTQFETFYKQCQKTKNQMMDIYIHALQREHGSKKDVDPAELRKWLWSQMKLHEDVWFEAEEAVNLGFAHEVFDGDWERLVADDWED